MTSFDTLVSALPASIQATARAARAFVVSLGADVTERCESAEAVYLRGQRPFCAIRVAGGATRLRMLPDQPGAPELKPLRTPPDLSSAVRAQIRAAYDAAR